MKKKLKLFVGIVFIVSLLLNGVLIYQNNAYSKTYKAYTEELEHMTGTISYYAEKELNYFSDTASMYSRFLKNIVNGDNILDDLMYYANGVTERDETMEWMHAFYFNDLEYEQKNELVKLVQDCNGTLYIANKQKVLEQLSDAQLQNLSEYYGEIERLLNMNNKNSIARYFRDKDYTSTDSKKAQSELRYVITCIDDLLDEKNINTTSNTKPQSPAADIAQPMQIEGKFVAKVRNVLPDYVLDDTTPRNIVVTTFQSGPFLINVGALADDLEIGKIYSFEITPKKLGTFKPSELDNTVLSPERAIPLYNLRIERIHDATEEAYSQDGAQLQYAVME